MSAVVVEALSKEYGRLRAVDRLSFTVAEGEVFALLGPNGAGKTMTVEILEGYRDRAAGRVSVLGVDPATGGRVPGLLAHHLQPQLMSATVTRTS